MGSGAKVDEDAKSRRGVQRHPRRRKMRHKNPRGCRGNNKEVGGGEFKFGQLNLRKIIKIVVIRCHILRLKQTKFDFDWGSDPDPAGGTHSHSTPTDPSGGFKGSYF